MSNFRNFVDLLAKYIRKERFNEFSDFIKEIQNLKCEDFRWYYLMAHYKHKNKLNEIASNYIIESISLLKDVKNNILDNIDQENCVELFDSDGLPLLMSNKFEQSAKVYFLAGEIFACLGKLDKSEEYYKLYNYNKSFLKSDFEGLKAVKLYSFRSISKYSLGDLVNRTITVCHPSVMNDPFDSPVMLWSDKKNLDNLCSEKNHVESYSKTFDYFRIRCFSMCSPKNILMWSHYADNHKGFCIKYRLSNYFINESENELGCHMYLKKVNYTKTKNTKLRIDIKSIDSTLGYATKYKDWKYEKEVRLISYNPMIEGKYNEIELDSESNIEAIYFGYRCSDQDIQTIKNICIERYNNINFYKMTLNTTDIYNFNAVKI